MSGRGRLASRPGPAQPSRPPGLHAVGNGLLVVPDGEPRPRPLLVFFHGAGGRARDSLPVLRQAAADAGVLVLLPNAHASTWDVITGGVGPDVAALDRSLAQVFAEHPVDTVAFGGFSDGASYALSLGLANGDLAHAVLAFSPGFAAPPSEQGRPRVWVAHGTADAVLPVELCGRRVVRLLTTAGYDVRYDEFDGPHVVRPQDVPVALGWWLRD